MAPIAEAKETLSAGDSGYSALVALYGVGIVVGASLVSRVRAGGEMKFLLGGILLFGVATLGTGLAGVLGVALITFALAGCGEGLEGGFDWMLVVRFRDRAALDAYLPHPEHLPVAGFLRDSAARVVVFDIAA